MRLSHDPTTMQQAARLFVEEGRSLTEIATMLPGVSRRILEQWRSQQSWVHKRRQHVKGQEDLDELLTKLKWRLARLAFPEGQAGSEWPLEVNPQQINALCRVIAVLSPPAQVVLRRLDQEEAETNVESAEQRMARVMDLLIGAGFATDAAESGSIQPS